MALTSLTKDFVVRAGLVVEGSVAVTTSTVSGTNNQGALRVYSGIATPQNLMIGSTASVWGPTNLYNTLNVSSDAVFGNNVSVTNLFTASGATYLGSTLKVNGDATFNNNAQVNNLFTASGAAYFGSTVESSGVLTVDDNTAASSCGAGPVGALVVGQGGLYVKKNIIVKDTGNVTGGSNTSTAAVSIQAGGLYVNGAALIDTCTAATSAGAGALIVAQGGAYIKKNLYVSGTCSSTSNTASNSLYTAGGAGIAKCLAVGGNAVVAGNLTVLGVQTIINSTATYIEDPVFSIGGGACGANLAADDGMHRGLLINYYSGSANNHMFLGRNDCTGHLVLRTNIDPGTSEPIPNADLVNNGSYAALDLGTLIVNDTTNVTTGSSTGALQVAGGAYIASDLQVGGHIWGTVTAANNVTGGALGQIPIQAASGVTTFIPAATANNQLLTWCSANSTATWKVSSASKFACYSGTATNIAWGAQWEIPFQNGTSSTTFNSNFKFDPSASKLQVDGATLYGKTCAAGSPVQCAQAVLAACGKAVVYSGASAQLNYNNAAKVTANSSGVTLGTGACGTANTAIFGTAGSLTLNNGSINLTSGNVTLCGVSAYVKAAAVKVTGLTNKCGGVVYAGACGVLESDSGLSYNGSGNLTVGTQLQVNGSGGSITMTGGTISGANCISAVNCITAGHFKSSSLASANGLLYSNACGTIVSDTSVTVSCGTLKAANVDVTTLGNTQIVYACGSCGSLAGNSSFTFAGSTLNVPSICASTGITSLAVSVTGLTCKSGGVVYAGTNGALTNSGSFTWNGTTLYATNVCATTGSVTGNKVKVSSIMTTGKVLTYGACGIVGTCVGVSGNTITAACVNVTSLKCVAGGVVYAGICGKLTDSTGFTYASSTLTTPKAKVTNCTAASTSACGTGALVVTGGAYVGKNVIVNCATAACGASTGALYVTGGANIAKNVIVQCSATSTSTTSSNALAVSGGVGISKNLLVGGCAIFNGNVYVDGTLFVKGQNLSGLDSVSGSTGTFQDIVSTGTVYANAITATSLTVTGPVNLAQLVLSNATLTNLTVKNAAVFQGVTTVTSTFNVTGDTYLAGTTATSLNVTGKSTLNNVVVTGDSYLAGTTATTLNVTGNSTLNNLTVTGGTTLAHVTATSASLTGDLYITSTDGAQFMSAVGHIASSVIGQGYTTACAASVVTEGGVRAGKDIVIGGVVVAGDATNNIGHTGTNGIFIVNNVQAAIGQSGISGSSKVTIDTFSTDYASAKYLIQLVDGANIHTEEILLIQDGTNVYMNQFSVVTNNGELGQFDADISGSVVELTFTPTGATSLTVQVVRQSILSAIPTY